MASPEEYRRQIKELGLDRMEIRASSLAEAKAALTKVRGLQKQLRQIKRNINLDMKAIRAEYRQKSSSAGAGSSAVLTVLGKRKLAGQARADAKRRLSTERDRKLAPYANLKLMIDDLLTQMDNAKVQIEGFIEEAKAEDQAQKQAAKAQKTAAREGAPVSFCPQCGLAVVEQSDRFCRQCGHGLT
jgi:hypothetical protein